MVSEGRNLRLRNHYMRMADMCDLMGMQYYQLQYAEELKAKYVKKAKKLGGEKVREISQGSNGPVLDAASPEVGAILIDAFIQKKRLMGIRENGR